MYLICRPSNVLRGHHWQSVLSLANGYLYLLRRYNPPTNQLISASTSHCNRTASFPQVKHNIVSSRPPDTVNQETSKNFSSYNCATSQKPLVHKSHNLGHLPRESDHCNPHYCRNGRGATSLPTD